MNEMHYLRAMRTARFVRGAVNPPIFVRRGRWAPDSTPRRVVRLALALSMVIPFAGGCRGSKIRRKPGILISKKDVSRYITAALEHSDADVRRCAVAQLARARRSDAPISKALELVARADPSDPVRCAAICALETRDGPKAADTMLAILDHPAYRASQRPASENVRWRAITVLLELTSRGALDGETNQAVAQTAIRLLSSDRARDVRLLAARILAYHPTVEALDALIDALRQNDFGVVYEAERSLTCLTGKSHDHNHARWVAWLASTEDPFAGAESARRSADSTDRKWWWPFRSRRE